MNALLIHNDNLPTALISNFKNTLKFNIGYAQTLEFDFTFDKEAHNQLNDALDNKSFDTIFIPYSLSGNNYLELSGLRLALHIRLTNEFGHKKTPIVFFGHETKEQITKISDYGSFLFSSGIFSTSKFEYQYLEEQYFWITTNWKQNTEAILNDKEYNSFLKRTTIEPAASHQSHHSIVNEWSIYQWAQIINGVDKSKFKELFEKIEADLYFKYIKALHPLHVSNLIEQSDVKIYSGGKDSKVLLVDDESDKGWSDLFIDMFEEFFFYDIRSDDFKNKTEDEFLNHCLDNIIELKIDLVILDFRLFPQDHSFNQTNEMTSVKLLKVIKEFNPGIQVIIFSATDKVWNLNALQRSGADGFVNKGGSIELQSQYSVKNSIESFVRQVQESLNLRYLKNIYSSLSKIKNNISQCDYEENSTFHDFLNELKVQIGIIEEIGRNVGKSPKTLDFMFLACFHFLEKFKNQYFKINRKKQYFIGLEMIEGNNYYLDNGNIVPNGKMIDTHLSWFNTMVNLLVHYFEVPPREYSFKTINDLAVARNNYTHEEMSDLSTKNLLDIVKLMEFATCKMKE